MCAKRHHEDFSDPDSLFENVNMNKQEKLLKPNKLIRIAVSGDVLITDLEKKIIGRKDFQRLRKLKQLGSAYLIYPTALHTRFDHSLGALHMVDKMIRRIKENRHNNTTENNITSEEEILARLFALLHDITHIPFGHTLEDEFRIFDRHDEDDARIKHYLGKESEIGKDILTLGEDMYNRFFNLVTFQKKNGFETLKGDAVVYDLVGNTVCADLLDYLQRDHFFCNLPLGLEYRFLNFLYVYEQDGIKRVAIRLMKTGETTPRMDVLNELVALLEYRYKLAEVVYFHHTKLISGAMLAGAVLREKKQNKEFTKELLFNMGDDELISYLKSRGGIVGKLANCFDNRVLWKEICKKTNLTIRKEDDSTINYLTTYTTDFHDNVDKRLQTEKEISECMGLDDGDFLLYCPDPKMQLKYAEMKVFWQGEYLELKKCFGEEISLVKSKLDLILKSHENLFSIRGFLNPNLMEEKDIAYHLNKAFDKFFNYSIKNKEIRDKEYAEVIIERYIKKNIEVKTASYIDVNILKENCVKRFINPTDKKERGIKFIIEIVNEEAGNLGINLKNDTNQLE